MRGTALLVILVLLSGCAPQKKEAPISARPPASTDTGVVAVPKWQPDTDLRIPPDERAEALLVQMTLDEKMDYIGGDRSFYIRPIERLGIPEIKMSDGPVGCRNWGASTAYPATIGLAATFDTALAEEMGGAIARDCRARGVHILLGPGVNIHRSPLTGRNAEYMGEDPWLAGEMAAAYIRGVQTQGVTATVKHFVANNQEWDRNNISSGVDERTLREIYFPAFERAVIDGGAKAVMTAYNLLNGTYCSHHTWLLKEVLKGEWGFDGIVMSDWGAVHDALGAVRGGVDLEMPQGSWMNRERLTQLLDEGQITPSDIDDKVRRILTTIIAAGYLDRPQLTEAIPLDDPASRDTALEVARQSLVLLKNRDRLLPLERTEISRVALIGPGAHPAVTGAAGSAYVTPNDTVSLLSGLQNTAPGIPIDPHPGIQEGNNASMDEARAEVAAIVEAADVAVVAVGFGQSGDTNTARQPFQPNWPEAWALDGYVEAEGHDRPFDLLEEQVETAALVAANNPNTVVVLNAGGAVNLSPFIDDVSALIWAGYPGQEGGRAIAEVVWGDTVPSGKLPVTFAKAYGDYPSAPYYHLRENGETPYAEGIFVGYRGFDESGVTPLFPFGFGLSYTRYEYSDLKIARQNDGRVEVTFSVKNLGPVDGVEIAQVYVAPSFVSTVPRAPKTLAGFDKRKVAPGASERFGVVLEPRAFAYFDVALGAWVIEAGRYDILVGSSSRKIHLAHTLDLQRQVLDD